METNIYVDSIEPSYIPFVNSEIEGEKRKNIIKYDQARGKRNYRMLSKKIGEFIRNYRENQCLEEPLTDEDIEAIEALVAFEGSRNFEGNTDMYGIISNGMTSLLETNDRHSMINDEVDANNRKIVLKSINKSKFINELYSAYEQGKGLGYAGTTRPVGIYSKPLWKVLYRVPRLRIQFDDRGVGKLIFIDEKDTTKGICYSEWSVEGKETDKTMSFEDINKMQVQNYGKAYARYLKIDNNGFVIPIQQPKSLKDDNTYER